LHVEGAFAKREHIRRFVRATILAIELAHLVVVGDDKRQFAADRERLMRERLLNRFPQAAGVNILSKGPVRIWILFMPDGVSLSASL